eukprot:63230_1
MQKNQIPRTRKENLIPTILKQQKSKKKRQLSNAEESNPQNKKRKLNTNDTEATKEQKQNANESKSEIDDISPRLCHKKILISFLLDSTERVWSVTESKVVTEQTGPIIHIKCAYGGKGGGKTKLRVDITKKLPFYNEKIAEKVLDFFGVQLYNPSNIIWFQLPNDS